jgi:hypothetical protein
MAGAPQVTSSQLEPPRPRRARWGADRAVLGLSALAVWSHTIDEIRIGEFVAVPAAVATAALLGCWPRTRRLTRGVLALLLGLVWVAGAIPYHLVPLLQGVTSWQNVSGLQQLIGGVAILVLGARVLYRGPAAERTTAQ